MLILEDLYLGDVRPSERSFKRNSQNANALDELVKAGDVLTDTLTEKQKELFEDYMTAQREVNVDRKSTRLNSSHPTTSRMPSSA